MSSNVNKVRFLLNKIKFNKTIRVLGDIELYNLGVITIDRNVTIVSYSMFNLLSQGIPNVIRCEKKAIIYIGENVGISSSCIWAYSKIEIGKNTNIGAQCIIMDSDAHPLNSEDRIHDKLDKIQSEPIIIGDNVFIGTRVTILKGVSIGNNVIIGAGSLVCKSIPPNCIAAGNPCKVIKSIV